MARGFSFVWRSPGRDHLARELFVIGVVAVLLLVAPSFLSEFRLNQLGKFLTFAVVAIGIDLLWGYTGMLSLGQGVFFGLGGYAMAMYLKLEASGDELPDFMSWSGLDALPWFWEPFRHAWFALPAAVILPGLLAFGFGYVLFRSQVTGVYFSIVTQALALILSTFFVGQQAYTGGTNGLTNYFTLFGSSLSSPSMQRALYFASVAALAATYLLARLVTASRFGRLMVAVRDDEERVRFSGYNVALIKAVVFAVAAAMAGVAGALFVPQVGIISPANLGVVPSIEMVLWVAIGGRGTLYGAAAGAVLIGWARSYFSETYPETWLYLFGGLFIGSVVLFPGGVVRLFGQLRAFWEGRRGVPTRGGGTSEAVSTASEAAPGGVP
ncbi:MAG: urea ABC transporter permease subunit UrtC [Dehalococcoidia bacterium]